MSEPKIPNGAEIQTLPRWAQVAFAARCAHRVLPSFRHSWPRAPMWYVKAISRVVKFAERGASGTAAADAAYEEATDAARAAEAAAAWTAYDVAAAALFAYDAASAAAIASAVAVVSATDAAKLARVADAVAEVAAAATDAVAAATRTDPGDDTIAEIRRDFVTLQGLARSQGWDDNTPVSPNVFGPLWPEGPPPHRPSTLDATPHDEALAAGVPPLHVYIDPGNAPSETIQEVLLALSELHRAAGGLGLTFRADGTAVVAAREVVS